MELTSNTDNLRVTELRLGLPGTDTSPGAPRGSKRPLPADEGTSSSTENSSTESFCQEAPVAKAQVIGWPPIQSYRRNSLQQSRVYVKVSMDGAPYLRKVDLNLYKQGYEELKMALEDMFKCFSLGEVLGMERCSKGSDYAVTYEDKEGDWMLVGDVPWEMFVSSCKRLRIMKGSEARGQEN